MDVDGVSTVFPRRRFCGWAGAGGSAGARGDLLGTTPEDWAGSDFFPPPEPPEDDLGAGALFALAVAFPALDFAEGRAFDFAAASSSSLASFAAST